MHRCSARELLDDDVDVQGRGGFPLRAEAFKLAVHDGNEVVRFALRIRIRELVRVADKLRLDAFATNPRVRFGNDADLAVLRFLRRFHPLICDRTGVVIICDIERSLQNLCFSIARRPHVCENTERGTDMRYAAIVQLGLVDDATAVQRG